MPRARFELHISALAGCVGVAGCTDAEAARLWPDACCLLLSCLTHELGEGDAALGGEDAEATVQVFGEGDSGALYDDIIELCASLITFLIHCPAEASSGLVG